MIVWGHAGNVADIRAALDDPDPGVQAAALSALARCGSLGLAEVERALRSESVEVRRRAVDVALRARGRGTRAALSTVIRQALEDPDPLVVVNAAWFAGERRDAEAVGALGLIVRGHADARCREAAVAALGAIGDPAGLPAVLLALDDKPTVRRRATVALAGFDDPRVEGALRKAAADRDWQVRQAAGELLGEDTEEGDEGEPPTGGH